MEWHRSFDVIYFAQINPVNLILIYRTYNFGLVQTFLLADILSGNRDTLLANVHLAQTDSSLVTVHISSELSLSEHPSNGSCGHGRVGFRTAMTEMVLPALVAFQPALVIFAIAFDGVAGKHVYIYTLAIVAIMINTIIRFV